MGDDIEENDEGVDDEPVVVEDTRPRTDIAPLITDSLVAEINDKNWKVGIIFILKNELCVVSLSFSTRGYNKKIYNYGYLPYLLLTDNYANILTFLLLS